jgi:hypothetical protein
MMNIQESDFDLKDTPGSRGQITGKSRRDFLKFISLISAGTALSFRSPFFTEETDTTRARDHFSLNKFYPSVDSLLIPRIEYVPGTPFQADYTLFSLGYDLFRKEGSVSFTWKPDKANVNCECMVERNTESEDLKSYFYQISRHKNDRYLTPVEWTRHSRMAKNTDAPAYPFTELKGNIRLQKNTLHIDETGKLFQKTTEGTPVLKWAHWGLIPLLQDHKEFVFDWIDEKEQIYKGHLIRFREKITLMTKGGLINLCSFYHTGTGIIPTVYWLTENKVLLFVVSGTEVYVLDRFNRKQVSYNVPSGRLKRDLL